jgi:hypothetical protein
MEHITKLFGSDAGYRSNIWLEGQRLSDHGFHAGELYTQVWMPDRIVCLRGEHPGASMPDGTKPDKVYIRVVNKQGKNPAIRLEGKRIQDMFGRKFMCVKATFSDGRIVIEGYNAIIHAHERMASEAVPA